MNLNSIKDRYRMSFDEVDRLLRLDPETGQLWWRHTSGKSGRACRTPSDSSAYSKVPIGGWSFAAHRLVWLLHTGSWPQFVVDHINGDRHDNRPSNLRDVTHAENQRNQSYHRAGKRKPDYRSSQLKLVAKPRDGALTFNAFEAEMARRSGNVA